MRAQCAIRLLAALAMVGAWVTSAPAQAPGGAFDRLAPGEQRIARSLFDAQRRDLQPGRRLTLDQIAAKKGGEGWGVVFKDMKSQGLVNAKNLGQVVERGRSRGGSNGAAVNRVHDQTASAAPPSASVRGQAAETPRGVGGGASASVGHGGGHAGGRR